jgi:hypothetical protein
MRTAVLAVLVALAGAIAAEPAQAGGRARVSIGVGFGYPFWGPPYWGPSWYYPPPYYYYPAPAVVVPSQPITYVEQGSSDQTSWWYYCDASRGYYPYVKECPSGWERVPPAPPK